MSTQFFFTRYSFLISSYSQVLYPITLTVSIFSMQPAVIPFDLTKEWLYFSVFILVGVMSIIYWAMKKWAVLQKKIAFWTKVRQLEEKGSRVVVSDYLNEVVIPKPDLHNSRVLDEEESLGTRTMRNKR
jgi:hypothetical protein